MVIHTVELQQTKEALKKSEKGNISFWLFLNSATLPPNASKGKLSRFSKYKETTETILCI